jgi:acyl-CoA thioester hydrolase
VKRASPNEGAADPGDVMATDVRELTEDPRVLWIEEVIRFRDTDMNGHVNNSIFAVFAESGRVHYFRARVKPTHGTDTFYVVARLAIEFRAELHYPGRVRIGTWLSRLGRTSLGVAQVIVAQGGIVAETDAVCVLMDRASRRPEPFPDATRAAVEPLVRALEPARA